MVLVREARPNQGRPKDELISRDQVVILASHPNCVQTRDGAVLAANDPHDQEVSEVEIVAVVVLVGVVLGRGGIGEDAMPNTVTPSFRFWCVAQIRSTGLPDEETYYVIQFITENTVYYRIDNSKI